MSERSPSCPWCHGTGQTRAYEIDYELRANNEFGGLAPVRKVRSSEVLCPLCQDGRRVLSEELLAWARAHPPAQRTDF
jgi:hypothetical protein